MTDQLPLLIQSGTPLISIQTSDEDRALDTVRKAAKDTVRPLYVWSMTDGLQLPPDDAGLIASANFLGYLAGALAGASRSLPGNPRLWFLGGLLASALTSAAMALTTSLSLFLLIRFASGVASAFALVFSTSLILERLTAAGRGGLSALHFAGVGCGNLLQC